MIHLTMKSGSSKIGPISATRTNARRTCPTTCALLQSGTCYDMHGNQGIHRRAVDAGQYQTLTRGQFLEALETLTPIWRWCTGGDLPSQRRATNRIDRPFLTSLARGIEEHDQTCIMYTHKPVLTGIRGARAADTRHNRAAIRHAQKIAPSVAVNISCESIAEVDRARALGFPCTVTLPIGSAAKLTTPRGEQVRVCPQQLAKRPGFTCGESCRSANGLPICADPDRGFTVGFIAHGSGKSRLTKMILGGE